MGGASTSPGEAYRKDSAHAYRLEARTKELPGPSWSQMTLLLLLPPWDLRVSTLSHVVVGDSPSSPELCANLTFIMSCLFSRVCVAPSENLRLRTRKKFGALENWAKDRATAMGHAPAQSLP